MEDAEKRKQAAASWLDLQDYITELILERLPLDDYLRFAAVCTKWRSIQRDHRLRHSPRPPPMPHPLPCLVPTHLYHDPTCYSLIDQKFHPINFPASNPAADRNLCIFSSHGWLVVLHDTERRSRSKRRVYLLNPVSGIQIPLPTVAISGSPPHLIGALSAPPYDPQCMLLLTDSRRILLCRVNARTGWAEIAFGEAAFEDLLRVVSAVYCQSKFYCLSDTLELYVVDALVDFPSVKFLEMGSGEMPWAKLYLVESNGDILLVLALRSTPVKGESAFHEFQMYKADLLNNIWVKEENIGDHVLFLGYMGSSSFLAADVGCKANCIYYTLWMDRQYFGPDTYGYITKKWKVVGIFDLEAKSMIDVHQVLDSAIKEELGLFDQFKLHWIVPTLDYISYAKASTFERVIAEDS